VRPLHPQHGVEEHQELEAKLDEAVAAARKGDLGSLQGLLKEVQKVGRASSSLLAGVLCVLRCTVASRRHCQALAESGRNESSGAGMPSGRCARWSPAAWVASAPTPCPRKSTFDI
jgi:hypothetical protein